jgi:perosamine synthetase
MGDASHPLCGSRLWFADRDMSLMIPLAVPDLRGREAELLLQCVRDNWVSTAGPDVKKLEDEIAALTGRKHAIAVSTGTAGLHMALVGLGVGPGDRVAVPDWTFAATANAVCHAGAEPVFIDISPRDWAIDPVLLDQALAGDPTIRAVIAVDPLGHAADLDALFEVTERHGVALVEDSAAAIGTLYRGKPCGSFGATSVFSFNGNKTVTAGGGGMVMTDDDEIARIVRHVSTTARLDGQYLHDRVGYNHRMTNVNAAIGRAQLERLDEMVAAKRAIAARYDAALEKRNDMRAMPRPDHSWSTAWLYSIELETADAAEELVKRMELNGIQARVFWRSLSAQAAWAGAPSLLNGTSRSLSGTVVSLPCSSSLTSEQQDRVLDVLSEWPAKLAGVA